MSGYFPVFTVSFPVFTASFPVFTVSLFTALSHTNGTVNWKPTVNLGKHALGEISSNVEWFSIFPLGVRMLTISIKT